jgi:hypothetical protein
MFEQFSKTFLQPHGEKWFSKGLVIASAAPESARAGLEKLGQAFPRVVFDLLISKPGQPESQPLATCNLPPAFSFRHVFPVKRRLGGLRLLLAAREEYDLVVLFATGERRLILCRAVALLVMRPRRFFVFNEFGDGFWLHRDDAAQIRNHYERRYNWQGKRWRLMQARDRAFSWLRTFGRRAVWLALLPYRFALLLLAAALFIPALLLLLLLRTAYDTRSYRFRFFGKWAASDCGFRIPDCGLAVHPQSAIGGPQLGTIPAGHAPAPVAGHGDRRAPVPLDRQLKAERLTITGACDGLAWTPGKIQLDEENFLSFWVEGLPGPADAGDVRACLQAVEAGSGDGSRHDARPRSIKLAIEYVAPARSAMRQVNARLPVAPPPGEYQLVVSLGGTQSPPFPITLESAG